jgi:hypothetical protein
MAKYQYSDFLTGGEWKVASKLEYYDIVVPKNGGWTLIKETKDQIFRHYKFDTYTAKRMWKKWALRRSKDVIHQLTGLPIDSKQVKALHQNLADQFKTKFDEIYNGYGKYQEKPIQESFVFSCGKESVKKTDLKKISTLENKLSDLINFMNLKSYDTEIKDSMIKAFVASAS